MKYKIDCISHCQSKRSWEITPDGRVWPCCYFGNGWDKRNRKDDKTKLNPEGLDFEYMSLMSDPEFVELMETDPNWNNLEYNNLDDIIAHEYYWTKIWYPGWESDTPHPTCISECSVQVNEHTGEETGKARIAVRSNNHDE